MNDLHTAFEEDALTSSHPLSAPMDQVQTQSQIYEMYDAITYCKVKWQSSEYPSCLWDHRNWGFMWFISKFGLCF